MMNTRPSTWLWYVVLLALVLPGGLNAQTFQPDSSRDCVLCHVQWSNSFGDRDAVLLIPQPKKMIVAREDVCLGCHDGSVGDSRNSVWRFHGHGAGLEPTDGMSVSDTLPLESGALTCRTCHTAHAGVAETIADVFFLRHPVENNELCAQCHADHMPEGGRLGNHPLGGTPEFVTSSLFEAGGRLGPVVSEPGTTAAGASSSQGSVICMSCHAPHGEADRAMLVLDHAQEDELCLTCHAAQTPNQWMPSQHGTEPQQYFFETADQRQSARTLGTVIGDDDRLACLSCHVVHAEQAESPLLAQAPAGQDFCVMCHVDFAPVVGSSHDLRTTAAMATNLLGETAEQSGPCGACHTYHRVTRDPFVHEADATGLCTTCHRGGECASAKTGLPLSHPVAARSETTSPTTLPLFRAGDAGGVAELGEEDGQLACLSCHEPHPNARHRWLRTSAGDLCTECHAEHQTIAGSPHSFASRGDLWNIHGSTPAEVGDCAFCHAVHDARGPALWGVTQQLDPGADAACTTCHAGETRLAEAAAPALLHPAGTTTTAIQWTSDFRLPLFDAQGGRQATIARGQVPGEQGHPSAEEGMIGCATCHATHGTVDRNPLLLRSVPAGTTVASKVSHDGTSDRDVCAACHVQEATLGSTLHDERFLLAHGCGPSAREGAPRSCTLCHATHDTGGPYVVKPSSVRMPLVWPVPADRGNCLTCHDEGGPGKQVAVYDHPVVVLQNVVPAGEPGYMPLADATAKLGDAGTMVCATCHLPHGREDLAGAAAARLAGAAAGTLEEQAATLRALKPMVREYRSPNLCGSCHGFDGLRRYLYFHDAERRVTLPGQMPIAARGE
jgi:predicted CXXCH cytochrome family protein